MPAPNQEAHAVLEAMGGPRFTRISPAEYEELMKELKTLLESSENELKGMLGSAYSNQMSITLGNITGNTGIAGFPNQVINTQIQTATSNGSQLYNMYPGQTITIPTPGVVSQFSSEGEKLVLTMVMKLWDMRLQLWMKEKMLELGIEDVRGRETPKEG